MENPRFEILIVPDGSGPEEILLCDGTIRETRTESSIASEFPVGAGRVTSDHVQAQPTEYTADLFITESPNRTLERELVTDYSIREEVRTLGGQDARTYVQSRQLSAFERARALFNRLDDLRRDGRLMTLTTAMGQLPNMVITQLAAPHEGPASATVLSVEWKQIEIVDSEETRAVEVPRLQRAQDSGNRPPTDEEDENGNPPEPETLVPDRTALAALGDFFGGL